MKKRLATLRASNRIAYFGNGTHSAASGTLSLSIIIIMGRNYMSELTSPKDKTKNKPFSVWVEFLRFLCLTFAKNYPQSVLHFC